MAEPLARPRIVASIEARMGSSRLPGKALMDIGGKPALSRLVDRLKSCTRIDDIVVATSTAPADAAIAEWAQGTSVACHRGSENDVLQRVVDAHAAMNSDIVVEITGDCPLLDPALVDLAVETFLFNDCDVVSTAHSGTFPSGTDTQVFRTADLAQVARTIADPAVREHVSLHFYETPERYRVIHVLAPATSRFPELRLDLDYPEDIAFIRAIYGALEPRLGSVFGIPAIIELLKSRPDLVAINEHCQNKTAR